MSAVAEQMKPESNAILRAGIIAAVVTTVVNSILYVIGSQFTFSADAITMLGAPLTLPLIAFATFAGGIVAAVGYIILLGRFPVATAKQIATIGAVVIVIAMGIMPFTISNVDGAQILMLNIMHIVAALPIAVVIRQ